MSARATGAAMWVIAPSSPSSERKLDAVEELAQRAEQAGLTLMQLALGFATAQPAIAWPLVGPRTIEQLQTRLAAAEVVLADDVPAAGARGACIHAAIVQQAAKTGRR